MLDPALPLGLLGPAPATARTASCARRRGHRARAACPAAGQLLGHVLRGAGHVVAAGGYPAAEADARPAGDAACRPSSSRPASTPSASGRSTPPSASAARGRSACPPTPSSCVGVSRLVPRKGFDVLIDAAARLRREPPRPASSPSPAAAATASRLERVAGAARRAGALPRPGARRATCPRLYGCADVFAMLCRNRWGGLEQEGFGIVFLEAAAVRRAVGRRATAAASAEAVADGETGLVVRRPDRRRRGRRRARRGCSTTTTCAPAWARPPAERAETEFSYDDLAAPPRRRTAGPGG